METAVDEAVAAEVAEDVEVVAEGAAVAGGVDEASRSKNGIGGSKRRNDANVLPVEDRNTIRIRAHGNRRGHYECERLVRDAKMKHDKMVIGRVGDDCTMV